LPCSGGDVGFQIAGDSLWSGVLAMESRYAYTDHFANTLGTFYVAWLALEATIECAIGRFLCLTHRRTHIIMAGMEFGRKASLFHVLLNESSYPNKAKIGELLTTIQKEAKRNIFTHSLVHTEPQEVTFIHRTVKKQKMKVSKTKFTKDEFEEHVQEINITMNEFGELLNIDETDLTAFFEAAYKA
jgi:hypothetical protein